MISISRGDLIRLPGHDTFVEVRMIEPQGDGAVIVYNDDTGMHEVVIYEISGVEVATGDGTGDPEEVLAGMWSAWMAAASAESSSGALASSTLKPYPHQHEAVYGRMLPQPNLRFLLGDEPGTGKTIMGGLYAREAQRLGLVDRCLVVCPAHLVTKWQADFGRFLGGGLERIESATVATKAFQARLRDEGFWVVSLELAAMNPAVLDAIRPDRAGWDLVIVDEAHRMTPTAEGYYSVGQVLKSAQRFLAMTATPHRGNEWFFRSLMHLVDPAIYPSPDDTDKQTSIRLRPGRLHLLRRMKEELFDYDGTTRLFKERIAANVTVPLSSVEYSVYQRAQDLVETYFPVKAKTLGRMVYGKRTASTLYALAETLRRRSDLMGLKSEVEARIDPEWGDPDDIDPTAGDDAEVIFAGSLNKTEERRAIRELLADIDRHLADPDPSAVASKWDRVIQTCLNPHGIEPGGDRQLVVFTEYADTADWLTTQFNAAGYATERYSGRDAHSHRDDVRDRFMAGDFQVIVSTDAGNEGIDLQSAHVLVNWDIPWSLVTLEQRMGRIHRVGQTDDVYLYNVMATGTLEGDTYARLLERLVGAANEMGGKMFDCLTLVGQQLLHSDTVPLASCFETGEANAAIEAITQEQLRIAAEQLIRESSHLTSTVDYGDAVKAIQDDELERINPHIVERYLTRLATAGFIAAEPSALAGDSLLLLSPTGRLDLPAQLSDPAGKAVLVATSGDRKREIVDDGASAANSAVELGPAAPAFRALVARSLIALRPTLTRGGHLVDPTTITDYALMIYETAVVDRGRNTTWRHLIRLDTSGARPVPFEMLANLVAGNQTAKPPTPAERHKADTVAVDAVATKTNDRTAALAAWRQAASQQLTRLRIDLPNAITDPDERARTRTAIAAAVTSRQAELDKITSGSVGDTKLVGWARVSGTGTPEDPTEADSETISMMHVRGLLEGAGWTVNDVSRENVGYDLDARKGHLQRLVEVKGVWKSAASTGIRLTGGEISRAGIAGDAYWLYVIDHCHDGHGTLFSYYQDPAATFADLAKDVPILTINGSDLKAHQNTEQPA